MNSVKNTGALFVLIINPVIADWGPGVRLPDTVNSPYIDVDPCFIEEENTLYFASNRENPTSWEHDIYYSRRIGPNTWTQAEKIPGEVNSPANEGGPCLTFEGTKLYFHRFFLGERADIFCSERVGVNWGTPYKIPGYINRTRTGEMNPAVDAAGTTLFFNGISWPSNIAVYNIWLSHWTGTEWGTPIFIKGINTTYGEYDPAPTYDGNWLYFGSNRPSPLGMFLYRARHLGADKWGEVERLNENINVYGYAYCAPFVSKSGRYLFYARTTIEPPERWDIYLSEWSEPAVSPTSLGKIKALYR